MIFALSALSLPRPQESTLAPDATTEVVANLFKKAGLDGAYNKAASVVLKEVEDVKMFSMKVDEAASTECSGAQLTEYKAVQYYKDKKKKFKQVLDNMKSVCSGGATDMKQMALVETAFTTVDKELQALLTTPTWGLTAEQAAEAVEESHDEAMLSIDSEALMADAAEGKGDCAGARGAMQEAKRALKGARLSKKIASMAKSCTCHGTMCPQPPPSPMPPPSLPPAVCLSYHYCEANCYCDTNWFSGCAGGYEQKGTCGIFDERCCQMGHFASCGCAHWGQP